MLPPTPDFCSTKFLTKKNKTMKQLLIAATLLLTTTFSMNVNAQKVSDEDLKGTEKVYKAMMSAFGKA